MSNKFKLDRVEHETKAFRMPVALVKRLQEVAQEKNMSMNQLVIRCCEYALDNLDETSK